VPVAISVGSLQVYKLLESDCRTYVCLSKSRESCLH